MKLHERVYAEINLDHIAYNMEQMHQNIPSDTKMIGVIKTDGYGHGAVEVAGVLERRWSLPRTGSVNRHWFLAVSLKTDMI